MHVINANNVNDGLILGLTWLKKMGLERASRNGPVVQSAMPVATVYRNPHERVMFYPWRDANPFFHFYESLWMLAGRNDVAPLTKYVKRMESFSDDGKIFNAAYGHRWRHATKLDIDQLTSIVKALQKNPECRRQVLKIWAIKYDLNQPTKDAACNLTATFQINTWGQLDMVVFCRSNDIIWGCYGANAVHFSMLQEYMARAIGVKIGSYTQVSVNFHAYRELFNKMLEAPEVVAHEFGTVVTTPYDVGEVVSYPLMYVTQDEWDEDVKNFVTDDGRAPKGHNYHDPFFPDVALPIVQAHDHYKAGKMQDALDTIRGCMATDWRHACTQWLHRRLK